MHLYRVQHYLPTNPTQMNKNIRRITESDLHKYPHSFSAEELAANIGHLNPKTILQTQTLTADFCRQYIFDLDIEKGDEDSYLFDSTYIIKYQPHLKDQFDHSSPK